MSDSVKKWHEMNEDGNTRSVYPGDAYITDTTGGYNTFKYESPDKNENVILEKIDLALSEEEKKEAYKVLAYYEKNVILYAAKVLNDEGTL